MTMIQTQEIDLFRRYFDEKYPTVEIRNIYGINYYYVPFDITNENGMYSWKYISVKEKMYNYKGLINIIIGMKYDLSDTLGILFNYMDDPKNVDYKKEYNEFQSWRKFAKDFAKKHFQNL